MMITMYESIYLVSINHDDDDDDDDNDDDDNMSQVTLCQQVLFCWLEFQPQGICQIAPQRSMILDTWSK